MKTNKEVFAGIELLEGSLSEDFKEKYVNRTSKLGQEIKIGRPANKYGRTSFWGTDIRCSEQYASKSPLST
jgi:hypothetical protein